MTSTYTDNQLFGYDDMDEPLPPAHPSSILVMLTENPQTC